MGTHMPYGITQCYLPPGTGDVPALTPAEAGTRFTNPERMQDLGTAVRRSPCLRLHIAVAVTINRTVRGEIRAWVLSYRSRTS